MSPLAAVAISEVPEGERDDSERAAVRGAPDHRGGAWVGEGVGSLMAAGFVQKNVTVGGARGMIGNHERSGTPSLLQ